MTEIVDYKVVIGIGINQINKEVNSCIKDGWTPFGGISSKTYIDPNYPEKTTALTLYSQAMVLPPHK